MHTFQLAAHKFDVVKLFKRVLASLYELVKKVNKSSKATEKPIALCYRKLFGDCPIHWSSTFIMLQYLL